MTARNRRGDDFSVFLTLGDETVIAYTQCLRIIDRTKSHARSGNSGTAVTVGVFGRFAGNRYIRYIDVVVCRGIAGERNRHVCIVDTRHHTFCDAVGKTRHRPVRRNNGAREVTSGERNGYDFTVLRAFRDISVIADHNAFRVVCRDERNTGVVGKRPVARTVEILGIRAGNRYVCYVTVIVHARITGQRNLYMSIVNSRDRTLRNTYGQV